MRSVGFVTVVLSELLKDSLGVFGYTCSARKEAWSTRASVARLHTLLERKSALRAPKRPWVARFEPGSEFVLHF